jgi:hypothetical protein
MEKSMRIPLLVFLIFISFPLSSYAGGSYGLAKVQSLKMLSETDYILVIAPIINDDRYKDPNWDECTKFEVHGIYGWFDEGWRSYFQSRKPRFVSRENHLLALERLKQNVGKNKPVKFGSMISGFNIIDKKNPCVVESRALELDEEGAIYSYYRW